MINERRSDLAFLTQALSWCESVTPEPEVIRELETVRAIAATLSRETDALAETRTELGAIETEIARTRLEMQLAEVRHEAAVLQEALLKEETTSSSSDQDAQQGSANEVGGASASDDVPAVDDLKTAINEARTLLDNLQTDVRADISALTKGGGGVGPIELLEYRQACRDAVKAAVNQVLLDDLHDKDGNALVRIQIRAIALPGKERYQDTLGILRMELKPPAIVEKDSAIARTTYVRWLDYVNGHINVLVEPSAEYPDGILAAPRLLMLKDYFDLRYFEVQRIGADGNPVSDWVCDGLRKAQRNLEACWYLHVALPRGSAIEFDLLKERGGVLSELLRGAAKYLRGAEQKDVIRIADGKNSDCKATLVDATVPDLKLSLTVPELADMANFAIGYWRGSLGVVLQAMADLSSDRAEASGMEMAVQRGLGVESETVVEAAEDFLAAIRMKSGGCEMQLSGRAIMPPERFV